MPTQPLIMGNFDAGVSPSPHKGMSMMRNVDIESFPGAVQVSKATSSIFHTAFAQTFTADAGTDICTTASWTLITGDVVTLTTTTTLPAGLSTGTNYFIIKVSATTFKLAATIALADAGTQIDITDAGTGTHTVTTVNPGIVKHIIREPRGDVHFFQDDNGRVWYLGSGSSALRLLNGNTLTSSSGNGIVTFRNSDSTAIYLLAFRNAKIDIVDVFATSDLETPSWTNGWNFGGASSDTTLETAAGTANSHHVIVGQDNIIYFCDDQYIGSISETSGQVFDPSNTATYSGNNQALDLPKGEVAEWLEELGKNLLVAGNTFNKIYPWNRKDASFFLPLKVPENSIKKLKNTGDRVYILAGTWGNIYSTQGTYVVHEKKIPDYITNNSQTLQSNPVTWGGIEALNGKLLFGMSTLTSGNSGVYILFPDGRLVQDNIPSSGSGNVTAIYVENNFYYIGYDSGADEMSASRYSSLEGVIQDSLKRVATKTEKGIFSTLEVQLAKPASTGNVKISYRKDTSSSFTALSTFAADGSATSFKNDAIGLIDIENIQLQAEIDGTVVFLEALIY